MEPEQQQQQQKKKNAAIVIPAAGACLSAVFAVYGESVSRLAQAKEHGIMSVQHNLRNCAQHWTHITAQPDLGHKALNPPVHQPPLCTRLRRHTRAHCKAVTSAHTICPPKAGLWNPARSYRSLCCQTYMNYPAKQHAEKRQEVTRRSGSEPMAPSIARSFKKSRIII